MNRRNINTNLIHKSIIANGAGCGIGKKFTGSRMGTIFYNTPNTFSRASAKYVGLASIIRRRFQMYT